MMWQNIQTETNLDSKQSESKIKAKKKKSKIHNLGGIQKPS